MQKMNCFQLLSHMEPNNDKDLSSSSSSSSSASSSAFSSAYLTLNPNCVVYSDWSDESNDEPWWEIVHFRVRPKEPMKQHEIYNVFQQALRIIGSEPVMQPLRTIQSTDGVGWIISFNINEQETDRLVYQVNQSGLFSRITYSF